ncbi:tRNA pseudouridine(55) synthase TruB [Staphylococcus sp. SQ8-PEA]|uniref:tRNA pseudouridine synthase B n=1 Tax=Staphylococcus marylandisciuri TaxID=2981529 RepID=A0ABT2QS01_9STAP|nr:tRNA pseudouridine(55) synthase TruB [Staphylococcus marylandisciuri]MCU5746752.1 tRNA pseudouridine(55) synthase TruB [Staphylococcus marylandisciuri]
MYHGILPIYKERGLTSHDVVFKLRKILKTKKIGHTGTLDPEVDGVLPVCIGSATKVSDYIMEMGKSYRATVTIGMSTTTEDQTGEIIDKQVISAGTLSEQEVDEALKHFRGKIEQVPPMYSSVKVNGRKLYEYARNGETVERPVRQVYIKGIKRVSELHYEDDLCYFSLDITCGKGTYIRTLATDIGKILGLPAHMSKLTRLASGGFTLDDAKRLEDVKEHIEHDSLQDALYPIEYGVKGLPHIIITNELMKKQIKNGQKFKRDLFKEEISETVVLLDGTTNKVLALYTPHPTQRDEIKPKKVFN